MGGGPKKPHHRSRRSQVKDRRIVALVGLAFLIALVPALRGAETDPEAVIKHAREVVLGPNPPEHGLKQVLADVLGASLTILPKTAYAGEFKERVEGVRKIFASGAIFSDEAYRNLDLAYKLVSGGKAWQVPEELKAAGQGEGGIKLATKICADLLGLALAEYKAGRNEAAARDLLGFVLLVVTPIER
jgi:hypothetical protein